MVVFRICNKEEIDKVFNSNDYFDFGTLGSEFIEQNKYGAPLSYNKYEPDKRYLHFFKLREGIEHLNPCKGRYVCTYNIPDDILDKCHARGFYKSQYLIAERIFLDEYAIDSSLLNKSNLIRVEEITKTINFRDRDFVFTDDVYKIIYDTPEAKDLIAKYKETERSEIDKCIHDNAVFFRRDKLYYDDEYLDRDKKIKR